MLKHYTNKFELKIGSKAYNLDKNQKTWYFYSRFDRPKNNPTTYLDPILEVPP